jgi:multidrug efflux system outer membrane protein
MKSGRPNLALIAATLLAVGGAGCRTVGPEFRSPVVETPAAFQHATTASAVAVPETRWWGVFGDATLDQLETAALENSPTLAAAFARIEEARARFGGVRADTKFGATASGAARLAGETAEREIPVPGRPLTYRERGDAYRAGVDATFELDLWGRVRRSIDSAEAQVAASEADERAVRLVLTADVAQSYFALRTTQAVLAVHERTLASRRDAVGILDVRYNAGLAAELDVNRARVEVATLEAEVADLGRRRDQAANALAFLTARPVANIAVANTEPAASAMVPVIPPGLPSTLLRRRPDIAASEAVYRARNADIGVAEAARFPTIRLTGSAGFESLELGSLLGRPSQFWQFGPSFHVPLLDGGRTRAAVEVAQARASAAAAEYRQRGLTAFREVEDALIELRQQTEQAAAQRKAAEAAAVVVELATVRYDRGFATYLEVVEAQRSTLQIERARAELEGARFASTVRLIRALGGGWQ